MEFKRKIARIFLLSAVLMLIMNNVLPHHHHEEDVCYATSHCAENESDHHHDSDTDHHSENHQHDADFCQLDIYYLATFWKNPVGKSKCSVTKINQLQFAMVYDDTFHSSNNLFSQLKLISIPKSVLNSRCLTRALRAPPYC